MCNAGMASGLAILYVLDVGYGQVSKTITERRGLELEYWALQVFLLPMKFKSWHIKNHINLHYDHNK